MFGKCVFMYLQCSVSFLNALFELEDEVVFISGRLFLTIHQLTVVLIYSIKDLHPYSKSISTNTRTNNQNVICISY